MSVNAEDIRDLKMLSARIELDEIIVSPERWDKMADLLSRVAEHLEAEQWIACAERMPERGKDADDEGHVLYNGSDNEIGIAALCGHCVKPHWMGAEGVTVTHWRPLPPAPHVPPLDGGERKTK